MCVRNLVRWHCSTLLAWTRVYAEQQDPACGLAIATVLAYQWQDGAVVCVRPALQVLYVFQPEGIDTATPPNPKTLSSDEADRLEGAYLAARLEAGVEYQVLSTIPPALETQLDDLSEGRLRPVFDLYQQHTQLATLRPGVQDRLAFHAAVCPTMKCLTHDDWSCRSPCAML